MIPVLIEYVDAKAQTNIRALATQLGISGAAAGGGRESTFRP